MNEDLKFAFININEWLRFAEAKNAGLLALNAAAMIGVLQCGDTLLNTFPLFRGLLLITFCVSSLVCIFSVLAEVNKHFKSYKKLEDVDFSSKKSTLNYLFFGDVAQLSATQLIELYRFKVNQVDDIKESDKDLAGQIVNNAELALQKFNVFNLAGWITFSGTTLAAILICLGYYK